MSLFQTQPEPVAHPGRRRAVIVLIALLVIAAFAWRVFRFYPEKRITTRFLDTVVAGEFESAYGQWNPAPEYSFNDFMQDWGHDSPWGKIRSYRIADVEGKTGVVSFIVVVNDVDSKPVEIWVQRKTKALSFAPP
ncbi:MAG TPA: hypothetical protein VIH17_07415 [Candidatus Acidoferrales bacterium]